MNRLKHGGQPSSGSPITLTFAQLRALQQKVKNVPSGQGTELTEQERATLLEHLSIGSLTLGEGAFVQVAGFIEPDRDLKASSGESVNCRLSGPDNNDIHIPIVQHSDDTEFASFVAEPIPQHRPAKWNTKTFKQLQEDGTQLLIRGNLLFDNQHRVHDDPEDEEGLAREPKRFTLWEIHPITAVFACTKTTGTCNPADASQWREIK